MIKFHKKLVYGQENVIELIIVDQENVISVISQ